MRVIVTQIEQDVWGKLNSVVSKSIENRWFSRL